MTSSNRNFTALLALFAGNSQITGEFPSQRPVTHSFDISFWSAPWINGWVNNRVLVIWGAIALCMMSSKWTAQETTRRNAYVSISEINCVTDVNIFSFCNQKEHRGHTSPYCYLRPMNYNASSVRHLWQMIHQHRSTNLIRGVSECEKSNVVKLLICIQATLCIRISFTSQN